MSVQDLPVFDRETCRGAARCVAVCPTDALDFWNDLPWLKHPDRCASCAACVLACPTGAATIPSYVPEQDRFARRRWDESGEGE